jgi:hypothetical protein
MEKGLCMLPTGLQGASISLETVRVWLLRFGLVGSALSLWIANNALRNSEMIHFSLPVWLEMAVYVLSFALLVLAARRHLPESANRLIVLTALLVVGIYSFEQVIKNDHNELWIADNYAYSEYAALLLRAGENPYYHDMWGSYYTTAMPTVFYTPTIDHTPMSSQVYLAPNFLLLIPSQLLGIPSQYVWLLFFPLSLLVLYWGCPALFRPLALLPFTLSTYHLFEPLFGFNDYPWIFALLLMIWQWRRPWLRALLFGLVVAYEIQPWLIAPFLLVRLWHEGRGTLRERLPSLVQFAGVAGGVFLVFNLPLIIPDPLHWFHNVSDSFRTHILLGSGLSRLTELGIVMIPKSLFSPLMVVVLAVALFVYWRHFQRWREVMWLLPAAVAFFSYRSLGYYFSPWLLIFLFALMRSWQQQGHPAEAEVRSPAGKWSLLAVGAAGMAIIGVVVFGAVRPPDLAVRVVEPVLTFDDNIHELALVVTNHSAEPVSPRFSIRTRQWHQSVFWQIGSGPDVLLPGEEAVYRIEGTRYHWHFNYRHGAQVLVTDPNNSDRRAAAFLPPDVSPAFPGVVRNGSYVYWRSNETAPDDWWLEASPLKTDHIQPVDAEESRRAIRLETVQNRVGLHTFARMNTEIMLLDVPLQLWVKPPAAANLPPNLDLIYGVELTANDHRMWVLFGDEAATGVFEDEIPYIIQPAPREEWSLQSIDIRQAFADVGILIADTEQDSDSRFDWLYNFPWTRVQVGLLLAARGTQTPHSAVFGTFEYTRLTPDRSQRTQLLLEHPEWMLLWRGVQNREARNYDAARGYFEQAIATAPDEGRAYIDLGHTLAAMGDSAGALAQFEQARALITDHPQRYDRGDLADVFGGQAELLLAEGRCFEAAVLYEQARATYSSYPVPYDEIEACGPLFTAPSPANAGG